MVINKAAPENRELSMAREKWQRRLLEFHGIRVHIPSWGVQVIERFNGQESRILLDSHERVTEEEMGKNMQGPLDTRAALTVLDSTAAGESA